MRSGVDERDEVLTKERANLEKERPNLDRKLTLPRIHYLRWLEKLGS
jgi:hypothetical protein